MNKSSGAFEHIHVLHHGLFCFSIFEGRHPSWCEVKILQGEQRTLVLLWQPSNFVGTSIVNAAEHIVTELTNLFGLDPTTTTFVHLTPPTLPSWLAPFADDPLAKTMPSFGSLSHEQYEQISFHWMKSDVPEPVLKRYVVVKQGFPDWKVIPPKDTITILPALS